jgi:hypothetical protein
MRRAAIVGLILLLSLVGAACGEPSEDEGGGDSGAAPSSPEDPDTPVSSSPDPGGGGIDDMKAMRVQAHEGLVDIGPHRFEEAKVVGSGDALDIYFWDGIEECTGVDHAHLTYEAEKVSVNLFTGRNPETEVCTEQAVYKVFTVDLTEPLEGRKLVDGARGSN